MGKKLLMKLWMTTIITLGIFTLTNAQTFSASTPFEDIDMYDDTLVYRIYNAPGNAWGDVTVKVFYEGDLGDSYEFIDFYAGNNVYIGRVGGSSLGDCGGLDSGIITFPISVISALLPADSITIIGLPNADVDQGICTDNRARIDVSYKYCSAGTPLVAQFTVPSSGICAANGPITFSGMPPMGTYTGTNISGSTFNPTGLAPGMYAITYTATDPVGCTTYVTNQVEVLRAPITQPITVCPGGSTELTATGWGELVWFGNNTLNPALDTTAYTTPNLYATTTYYVAGINRQYEFSVDTLLETDSLTVDHDNETGDDRGGIAVTQNYVYVLGDNDAVRYNLDLTNPVVLPIRDGLFSDLATGKLYTMWNGTTDPINVNGIYTITALVELDTNLALTNNFIQLSSPVQFYEEYNGIFAGAGIVILYSDITSHFYVVGISTGTVTDLGEWNSNMASSENWASWGVAEYKNGDYYILYRDYYDDNIHRLKISNGDITDAGVFSDVSDLASFTVSPWNQRWYFHYEDDGQFGGYSETLGYADAVATLTPLSATLSCPSTLTVNVNNVDLGEDTVICEGNYVVLFAGTGYTQYAWNGTTTNYNAVSASEQGIYSVAVVDADGCTLRDTVNVIVNDAPNPNIDLGETFVYCRDAADVTLTATPANGTFSGNGITGSNFSPVTAGIGVHEITYTVTGNNGCVGSSTEYIVVDNCLGIEDLDAAILSVYPNPSTGVVYVHFNTNVINAAIAVYDIQGREVYTTSSVNNNMAQLDLSQIGNGVYVLRVTSNGNISTQRLLIQQ